MNILYREIVGSPIGDVCVLADADALVYVDFADNPARQQRLLSQRYGSFQLVDEAHPLDFGAALRQYFAGDWAAVADVPVNTGGTDFQQRVWLALRGIPTGQTLTYGELARELGMTTGAARAIGITNSLNPISIVLPCHRVIGANNALTGYAGGIERKRWLLQHEGAFAATANQQLAFGV